MKHALIIVSAFALITAIAIFNLRFLSGPEDTWLCEKGEWVMHGRPYAPMPEIPCGNPVINKASTSSDNISPKQTGISTADLIRSEIKIAKPLANEIISSPLIIEGQAKGTWYFEASFPIKLIGENGEVIAHGIAQAQSDWMTTDFVPFKATLNFDSGSSTIGMLIFQNDNPSGLPENEKQFGIPIRFNSAEQTQVKIYFGNTDLDSKDSSNCNLVFPVQRSIVKTPTIARATLEQLLSGTTDAEKIQGYFTSINPGVKINSLTIKNGTAKVDFDQQMDYQMGGSCRVAAIRAQITKTLEQFPTVKKVIISVNGNTDEALQP
jgi:hypothetical protein